MHPYLQGTVVLGALLPWEPKPGDQYVVLHLKDVAKVVREQGGATGGLAFEVAPQTISTAAYNRIAKELEAALKDKGIAADVAVRQLPPGGEPPRRDFMTGALVGAGAVGVGWALWRYVLSGLLRRR